MCIKSAPYLNYKSANRALIMGFFYALVLLLLTKFVPTITPLEGAVSACFFFTFDAKLAPNLF